MLQTFAAYRDSGGKRKCVCLYPEEGILEVLEQALQSTELDSSVIELRPVSEGALASAVLTSSGTMSLNCALAAIPGAIVYRAHPMTAWMGQRLISIEWLGIANLILNKELYPEFLQKDADPEILTNKLNEFLDNPNLRKAHLEGANDLFSHLHGADSETVARRIDQLLAE